VEELTVLHTGPLGVNTYIVPLTMDTVVIIDPAACAFTNDETKITDWLRVHNKTPAGIFITHGHFDHITGLPALKKEYPQCSVAIHKDDANALGSTSARSQSSALGAMGLEQFTAALEGMPAADVTFSDRETLDTVFTGNDTGTAYALSKWKIIHTPGHSRGSVCLYSESGKKLISGDTLFYRSCGRTDLGGNEDEMMHSIAMLRKMIPPETVVYPGHDYYGFTFAENF
jgi:hydroxyacylglutathione hydrolase